LIESVTADDVGNKAVKLADPETSINRQYGTIDHSRRVTKKKQDGIHHVTVLC